MEELSKVVLAFFLILVITLLSRILRLRGERDIMDSSIRTTLQLLVFAFVITYVLKVSDPLFLFFFMAFMSVFASFVAVERVRITRSLAKSILLGGLSLNLSTLTVYLSLYLLGVIKHTPVETVVLWGLLLGNSLNNVSLSVERLRAEVRNRIEELEGKVALGADLYTAMEDYIRSAVRASMIPKHNMLKSAGIVSIPGISAGMMIAGSDPLSAIAYQIVVMYMILSSGFLTSYITLRLTYRHTFEWL